MRFLAAFIASTLASVSSAQVTKIEYWRDNGQIGSQSVVAGQPVNLTLDNTMDEVLIYNDPPSANMGAVTVAGSTSQDVWVYIAATRLPGTFYYAPGNQACNNLASVLVSRPHTVLKVYAQGTIGGGVSAPWLINLQAGAIQSAIFSSTGDTNIRVGSVSASADITVTSGQLAVQTTAGDLAGDCIATNGTIATIDAAAGNVLGNIIADHGTVSQVTASGNIGSSGSPVTIRALQTIGTVRGAAVAANISTTATTGSPSIASLKTTNGDFIGSLTTRQLEGAADSPAPYDIAGDLVGSLSCSVTATRQIRVRGDLLGSITTGSGLGNSTGGGLTIDGNLSGTVSVGSFLSRPLVVGGDVLPGGRISVGQATNPQSGETRGPIHVVGQMQGLIKIGSSLVAPSGALGVDIDSGTGLDGQIIVNSSNTTGDWTADVVVGSTTLSPKPYYNQLASQLGGGAVGLAPFQIHAPDCTPAHMSVLTEDEVGEGLTSVLVRHYGPVDFDSGIPFVVMETELPTTVDIPDSPCWECCSVTTCSFTPTVVPGCLGMPQDVSANLTAAMSSTSPRDVIISTVGTFKFSPWHTYCIKPIRSGTGRLYCQEVATAPSVSDYVYRFSIIGNRYDLNRSGDVEYGDVSAWFDEPVDFNGDEAADSADLAELIEAIPQ